MPQKQKTLEYKIVLFTALAFFVFPGISTAQDIQPADPDASATTTDEDIIRFKIDLRNTQIKNLQEEIDKNQKELDALGKEKNTLQTAVQRLITTQKKLLNELKLTQKKLTTTNTAILTLGESIADKQSRIDVTEGALSKSIREMHLIDSFSMPELILSKEKLSDVWMEKELLKGFGSRLSEHAKELLAAKKDLEQTKGMYEGAKKELNTLNTELKDQKYLVDQNTKEKNKLLKETKNKETVYQKELETKLVIKNSLEDEIREYESQLKFTLDPSTLPPSGSRPYSWPLDYVKITQLFGKTGASGRLYASGTHNGVDFKASAGTRVKSMLSGMVIGTGDTDVTCPGASFGKWILIRSSNGLAATYGHLSLIKVRAGDTVSTGQVIGYSGNTGYSTGPHLHISVYAAGAVSVQTRPSKTCGGRIFTMPIAAINAYLDPMLYLPPYK